MLSCQDGNNRIKNKKNTVSHQKTLPQPETETNTVNNADNSDSFSVKTIFSPDIGWGYQVLNNGKLYINQPHIPAIAGIKGFSDESKAKITADFMLYKLNKGIFPPTISVDELDSLGVLNDD